jgi:transcriptional regulator with XRE-family HTH domain
MVRTARVYDVPFRAVLERHGCTREQFMQAAGISLATFRAYLGGRRTPSTTVVLAVEDLVPRHDLRPDLWPPPTSACRRRRAA